MAININNGVTNNNGTPGAYTGDFGNAPAANAVAAGTLWFDNIAGTIYQSDGISWKGLGGGGGSQNLQQVLTVGNTAVDIGIIMNDTTSGYYTQLNNNLSFPILCNDGGSTNAYIAPGLFRSDLGGAITGDLYPYYLLFTNQNTGNSFQQRLLNNFYETFANNVSFGHRIDCVNAIYDIGDYNNNIKGDYIRVDNTSEFIKTYMSNAEFGLYVDRTFNSYLGDYGGIGNGTLISIYDNVSIVEIAARARFTLYSTAAGLDARNGYTVIGDHDVVNNGSIFGVNDNDQKLLASSNLLVGTSGSSSGQHLKINVGGTDYVIELKNP